MARTGNEITCRPRYLGRLSAITCALLGIASSLPGQTLSSTAKAKDVWVLTFSEEFDKAELSYPKWVPHDPWGHERNREGQAYVPSAIEVRDGTARITARRELASYDGRQREFTSGIMTTVGSFAQTYGRFEIRCRAAAGKGLESKFWLLPRAVGRNPGDRYF